MARDWNEATAVSDLVARLKRLAPGNTAPIPLSMSLENGQWTVDVHVRVPRMTEYEVTGIGDTLLEAIQRVHGSLNYEVKHRQRAYVSNAKFGIVA